MFKDNDWYSHKKSLADYCNEKVHPVCGTIQHGWYQMKDNYEYINALKISKIPFNNLFCWNENIKNLFKKNNINNVITIGAPFIYFTDKLKNLKKPRNNLLVFHPHSDFEKVNRPSGFKNIQNFIDEIKSSYKGPYGVCLFYQDMTSDIINIYKKNSFDIFSCGTRLNQDYFSNFLEIIETHNEIVVCELTSAALYALHLNKNVYFHRVDKISRNYFDEYLAQHEYDFFNDDKNIVDLINNKTDLNKKRKIANEILGVKFKRTPEELKKILGWDSKLKKVYTFGVKKIKLILDRY